MGAIERLANIDSTDALKAFLATRVLFAILAFNQDWKRLSVAKAMASPYGSDSVPKQEG